MTLIVERDRDGGRLSILLLGDLSRVYAWRYWDSGQLVDSSDRW